MYDLYFPIFFLPSNVLLGLSTQSLSILQSLLVASTIILIHRVQFEESIIRSHGIVDPLCKFYTLRFDIVLSRYGGIHRIFDSTFERWIRIIRGALPRVLVLSMALLEVR
jgi:hypothetical protein